MTRDEAIAGWNDAASRLLKGENQAVDLLIRAGDALLAAALSTPAPVGAPVADLVALVRRVVDEFTEYEVPDDIRGVAPRVADALRDLAAFPLPEVPK